jgi:hypothetical protein
MAMGCTHGHPVLGAVVPGVLPLAAPGAVAGARAFFFLVRMTKFLSFFASWIELNSRVV